MSNREVLFPEVLEFKSQIHRDERGYFFEAWKQSAYRQQGLTDELVQLNISRSTHAVLRGLHYQLDHPQAKLISVISGEVFDVAVYLRRKSPTFGKWVSATMSAGNKHQLWVPEGFAHGFLVLSDAALFHYHCTTEYSSQYDAAIAWNDPDIAVKWPCEPGAVSDKDRVAPLLCDVPIERLPSGEK